MNLSEYFVVLIDRFRNLSCCCPEGTPYGILGEEVTGMIQSYLDDSSFFSERQDIVNHYASLAYAHGWLSAGIYLGIIVAPDLPWVSEAIILPDSCDQAHLMEKSSRYRRMLTQALESVECIPARGSPLYPAALTCRKIAGDCLYQVSSLLDREEWVPALGLLSYGYGWLDTGVRAGFFCIKSNPGLFTTED